MGKFNFFHLLKKTMFSLLALVTVIFSANNIVRANSSEQKSEEQLRKESFQSYLTINLNDEDALESEFGILNLCEIAPQYTEEEFEAISSNNSYWLDAERYFANLNYERYSGDSLPEKVDNFLRGRIKANIDKKNNRIFKYPFLGNNPANALTLKTTVSAGSSYILYNFVNMPGLIINARIPFAKEINKEEVLELELYDIYTIKYGSIQTCVLITNYYFSPEQIKDIYHHHNF